MLLIERRDVVVVAFGLSDGCVCRCSVRESERRRLAAAGSIPSRERCTSRLRAGLARVELGGLGFRVLGFRV